MFSSTNWDFYEIKLMEKKLFYFAGTLHQFNIELNVEFLCHKIKS